MPKGSRVIREWVGLLLLVSGGIGAVIGLIGLITAGQAPLALTIAGLIVAVVGWGLARYDDEVPAGTRAVAGEDPEDTGGW